MKININLMKNYKKRSIGLSMWDQFAGGVIGSLLGLGFILTLVFLTGSTEPHKHTVCDQLMALAQTRSDTLLVFTTKPGSSNYTCFEEFNDAR